MNETQSAAELRRSWFRGVRSEDVDEALGDLERRNYELEAKLAAAGQEAHDLTERVAAAEARLESFHASFEHIGEMLSLAEERARQLERDAEIESMRIRSEAEERVRAAEAEVEELAAKKHETLAALGGLRARLTELGAQDEMAAEVSQLPAPAVQPAEPQRITVADLLALEAEGAL